MRPNSSKPASLADIARKAGVSKMTVSYALRSHPKVSEKTRLRVLKAARQLRYFPDARMAERTAQIRNAKTRELLPIAWLNMGAEEDLWHRYSWLSPYLEGAQQRSFELGYKIDEIWARQPGMTNQRLSDIIYNRGIRGIIVAPPRETSLGHVRLDWRHFAAVTFEGAILAPRLHRVMPDYYFNLLLALKTLRRAGYRRIGLLLDIYHDQRSHHAYLGAINYFHSRIPKNERVRPLFYSSLMGNPFAVKEAGPWLRKAKPDVIVGQHSLLPEWLKSQGHTAPEAIGLVHLALDADCTEWTGIWQRKHQVGAEAIELCISMIRNNRFGLPETPYDILIPGNWKEGNTLASAPVTATLTKKLQR